MVKVLRKYNKWLLAGGGSLLMLTFLISGSNNPFAPDPDKITVAEVLSKPVTNKERNQFSMEFDALKSFVPGVVLLQIGCKDTTHWMLLVREAENAGLVGEGRDGAAWLPELAQSETVAEVTDKYAQYGPQLVQQFLQNAQFMQQQAAQTQTILAQRQPVVAAQHRMTPEQFDHALSRLRGVARLINTYDAAARMSDKLVVLEARQRFDSVLAEGVVIPADVIAGEMPEPTEEQLQAHFKKYQGVKPIDGEFGIGYVLPERIKLEWFEVDAATVSKSIKLDPIAVSKAYQLDRTKYPGEFGAEKAKLEETLLKAKTDEVMTEIDRVYKARLRAATRRLEVDGPIRKLPADWETQRPTIDALAADVHQAVQEAEGVTLPTFKVTRLADKWTRLDEAGSLPGIGRGVLRLGTRTAGIEELLASDVDFDPKSPFGLQTLVPSDVALESGQVRYYFCVLATKGEAPAESLDEVRARAAVDFKRLAAFEKLTSEIPQFRSLAASEGLDAVGKSFEKPAQGSTPATPAIPVIKELRVSRTQVRKYFGQNDPNVSVLDVPAIREEVVKAAQELGPTAERNASNLAARTSVVAIPRALAIGIIQSTTPVPLSREDLHLFSRDVVTSLRRLEQRDAAPDAKNPFSLEALKERMGYKSKGKDSES